MQIFTETNRLFLREILPSDVDGLFELDSDPEVNRYLGNKPVQSKEQTKEIIQFIRQQYVDNGIGRWAIIDKTNNNFIGWTGLKLVRETINNHTNYYDLGYRLIKRYWGQGIATESALASLQYGFDVLKANEIYAMAQVENKASNKILANVGFSLIETFTYDNEEHNWYKIERDKFGLT